MWTSRTKMKELEDKKGRLQDEVLDLKQDLALVRNKKKMEEEDIKHMVKMSKEKNEIELKKKIMDVEREQQLAIAKVKDEYRDKLEKRLKTEVDNIKEMYGQILERLPNVTARLKGDI